MEREAENGESRITTDKDEPLETSVEAGASSSASEEGATSVPEKDMPLRENIEEIQRRARATTMENAKYFEASKHDYKFDSVELPDQEVVLYSLSHAEFAPVCTDARNPGIRFYGAFPSAEEASEFAQTILGTEQCSMMMHPVRTWGIAFSSPSEMKGDPTSDIQARLDAVTNRNKERNQEFSTNVSEKSTGDAGEGLVQKRDPVKTKEDQKATRRSLPAALRGTQRFGVVCFVRDTVSSEEDEPARFLFSYYGGFETEEECDAYIRTAMSLDVTEFDIDVVSLNEWVFPQHVSGHMMQREEFRNPELHNIIQQHKSQPSRINAMQKRIDESVGSI